MIDNLSNRREIEDLIRAKLIELIELGMEHHIPVQTLMFQALDIADPESG
jgi:hypothetical protein